MEARFYKKYVQNMFSETKARFTVDKHLYLKYGINIVQNH